MIDRYRWRGGEELIMRWGAQHDLQVVLFEPLFEEKNRMRRLIAQMATRLDAREIGVAVPDLPGTGESLTDIGDVAFADWVDAAASATEQLTPHMIASIRGGALIDGAASTIPRWRFSPETGARLIRDLRRTHVAGGDAQSLGGHHLSADFIAWFEAAIPPTTPTLRTVRLMSDQAEADLKIDAPPLWRRAEPGEDSALALALADDLAAWTTTCAAS